MLPHYTVLRAGTDISNLPRDSGMGMEHRSSNGKCLFKPAKFSILTCWSLYNLKNTSVVNIFLTLRCYTAFEFQIYVTVFTRIFFLIMFPP